MRGARLVVVAGLMAACGEMIPAAPDAGTGGDGGIADAAVVEANASDAEVADASGDAATEATVDAGCPAETCANRTGCTLFDFGTDCAPWSLAGNTTTTTHDCVAGKLHLAAQGTDDITVSRSTPTPTTGYKVHVAARIAITDWDGGRVLRVQIGGNTLVQVRADDLGGGQMQLTLCRSSLVECATQKVSFKAGTEHLVVLDVGDAIAQMTVDCISAGEVQPSTDMNTNSTLSVQLGKTDAAPIDGTFADVLVWFVTS